MEASVASGAPGRANIQVDASTTRMPAGAKKQPRPANKIADSYLQRYQEQQQGKKSKRNVPQDAQNDTEPEDHPDIAEDEEVKEEAPATTGNSDDGPGKTPSGERPKKSRLCVLL